MNNKKYDITALGELLIDFIPSGTSSQGNPIYEANPGGAPCNVLAMASNCGSRTAFIGKIGDDAHGHFLRKAVEDAGIDTQGLISTPEVNTTLAFVSIDEHGERSFSFYREPGADMTLTADEVQDSLIENAVIFHFGTLSMTHKTVREATKNAVATAQRNGCLISFDPNLRPLLWKDMEEARRQMQYGVSVCDILKIEDEELKFMTQIEDVHEAVRHLQDTCHISLILVTSGADGSEIFLQDKSLRQAAFLSDDTIDTTGAGDTFFGYCLAYLANHAPDKLTEKQAAHMLEGASAAASIVTTRKGALRSMPYPDEIQSYITAYHEKESKNA